MIKQIAEGKHIDILVGDWVDVLTGSLDPDPSHGLSFQVTEVPNETNYLFISALVSGTNEYAPTALSYENVTDNYRKVPFEA